MEYVVHVALSIVPKNLSIACYEMPDDVVPEEISVTALPKNWRTYPSPSKLTELGSEWALANRLLLLRVPSAIVPDESNILINPKHPEITRISIYQVEKCALDRRLL